MREGGTLVGLSVEETTPTCYRTSCNKKHWWGSALWTSCVARKQKALVGICTLLGQHHTVDSLGNSHTLIMWWVESKLWCEQKWNMPRDHSSFKWTLSHWEKRKMLWSVHIGPIWVQNGPGLSFKTHQPCNNIPKDAPILVPIAVTLAHRSWNTICMKVDSASPTNITLPWLNNMAIDNYRYPCKWKKKKSCSFFQHSTSMDNIVYKNKYNCSQWATMPNK